MSLALIVIPDPSTPSREDGLDAQLLRHLPRLEDPTLRVDQRNALAAELELTRGISGISGELLFFNSVQSGVILFA
jgi:hypothetical protein